MPLKSFFDSSRYLNRLPRYNESKFRDAIMKDPRPIFFPGNVYYYVVPRIVLRFFHHLSEVWDRSVRQSASERFE